MFIKSFRVKSQTQVKGSERKKIRAELWTSFPGLNEEQLADLLPQKADLIAIKVYCSKGESVIIYQIDKEPLFFTLEKEKGFYPTVYTLWRYPNLVPVFTTHPPVIQNLANGADLMLPGVVIKVEASPIMYGRFERGELAAINTTSNMAPHAVGLTAHCNMDMYMAARHGKCINVIHVYGDFLWQMGSKSPPPLIRPSGLVEPDDEDEDESDDEDISAENKMEEDNLDDEVEKLSINEEAEAENTSALPNNTEQELLPVLSESEQMDQLLEHCLIKAIKTSMKKVDLPLLTSNFYAKHMIPACPDNRSLDIKKSSYKKLSKFLGAMNKRGFIVVKEFPKGVENVTDLKPDHEDVKFFRVDKEETTVKPVAVNPNAFVPPMIEELYQVSGTTIDFFRANKLCKGDVLSSSEIRHVVTDYINRENLKAAGSNLVHLNPLLHGTVVGPKEGFKETLKWDEIFSRLLGKMSPATRITPNGQVPIIKKGKLKPIQIELAKRTGNKKVTLIYNVAEFGIDESEFAHKIQVGVAASTSVGAAENKPQGTTQVLVQGSQVAFIGKLLIETYNIPRKYIKGLELAVKEKKAKRH